MSSKRFNLFFDLSIYLKGLQKIHPREGIVGTFESANHSYDTIILTFVGENSMWLENYDPQYMMRVGMKKFVEDIFQQSNTIFSKKLYRLIIE